MSIGNRPTGLATAIRDWLSILPVSVSGSSPPSPAALQQENLFYILQESGSKILLES